MANAIKLRKGLDISLKGLVPRRMLDVSRSDLYALSPDDFAGLAPKVVVKADDRVSAGSPLFVDKKRPDIRVVSPVSGVVTAVVRGARRKVMRVEVRETGDSSVDFGKKEVAGLTAEAVIGALLESGLFCFIRQRPYDAIADPAVRPKAIFVSAFDSRPLAPDFEYVIRGEEANFQTGLDALSKIAKTCLGVSVKQTSPALAEAKNVVVNWFDGPHPAGNVGVQIHHIDPVNKGETVWTLGAEEVLFVGRLFNTGRVDLRRTIALTGSEVIEPGYTTCLIGCQLTPVFKNRTRADRTLRYISGNVLTGKRVEPDGYLGAFDTQLMVIPEGSEIHEFLGFIRPRFDQYSVSRSYFGWLIDRFRKREYRIDARLKGGKRNLIMSNEYDRVLPMDIYPELLIKAIIAGDIDRMEQLGIYEVAPEDFALCEFVCSSKQELQQIVRDGLDLLRAEMT